MAPQQGCLQGEGGKNCDYNDFNDTIYLFGTTKFTSEGKQLSLGYLLHIPMVKNKFACSSIDVNKNYKGHITAK